MFRGPEAALLRLHNRELRELAGIRAARAYTVGIAISLTLLILIVPAETRALVARVSSRDALTTGSWIIAGLSALAGAKELAAPRARAYTSFSLTRGFAETTGLVARLAALALRIAVSVLLPLATVLLVAWLSSARGAAWCGAWLIAGSAYALALGALLALLALLCARISPRNARLLLFVIVLGPELFRHAGWDKHPSLPALCAWSIDGIESFARMFA